MPFNFRALPVENLTGVTENFEQLVALRFKGTALEGSIEEPIFRKPEAWKQLSALTYKNSWENFEAGARHGEYRKDGFGNVILRGAVKGGESAKAIVVLPTGYRPKNAEDFGAYASAGFANVNISTAGVVTPANITAGTEVKTFISLSGISFSVE